MSHRRSHNRTRITPTPQQERHTMQYIKEYGGHMSESSDPDRLRVIRELVAQQSKVKMLDLMAATSYTDTTIGKALLKSGWLQVADGKPVSASTWEKINDEDVMVEGVSFRPRLGTRTTRQRPAPVKTEPLGIPETEWITVDPEGTYTVAQLQESYTGLGFAVRIQVRILR